MKPLSLLSFVLFALVVLGTGCSDDRDMYPPRDDSDEATDDEEIVEEDDKLRLTSFEAGGSIDPSTGITLIGEAKGPWYFEAVFRVSLIDDEGNLLAQAQATATEEWMTTEWVSFEAELPAFNADGATTGKLVFENDNPSGLPENAERVEIDVVFMVPFPDRYNDPADNEESDRDV